MGIPADLDCLTFARRAAAAHFNGTIDQLLADFARAGDVLNKEDVIAYAQLMSDTFRIGDAQKTHCYICDKKSEADKLCSCFDSVTPKRHYNVHNVQRLAELPPNTIVETFACEECALLGETTAEGALATHARHGEYKTHRFCSSCFDQKKRQPRAKRPRHEKHAKKPQSAPQAPREYLSDMIAEATAGVTQGLA